MTQDTAINLNYLATKLTSSNKIQELLKDKCLNFTAKKLSEKFSELKALNDLVLITLNNNELLNHRLLSLYRKDDSLVLVTPDTGVEQITDFELLIWQAGDINEATIVIQDVTLEVPIIFERNFLSKVQFEHSNNLEGTIDDLKIDWLRKAPNIELNLSVLPKNVELRIIKTNKRSEKYKTLMIDVIDSTNNQKYKNICTNSDLRKLIANNYQSFIITGIREFSIVDNDDSKNKTRTANKVMIQPVDNDTSFDDLVI